MRQEHRQLRHDRPRFAKPVVLFGDRYGVDGFSSRYKVMDKMCMRSHPNLICQFKIQVPPAIRGDETAIGCATGVMRIFRPEKSMPYNRMNSVGSDKGLN